MEIKNPEVVPTETVNEELEADEIDNKEEEQFGIKNGQDLLMIFEKEGESRSSSDYQEGNGDFENGTGLGQEEDDEA